MWFTINITHICYLKIQKSVLAKIPMKSYPDIPINSVTNIIAITFDFKHYKQESIVFHAYNCLPCVIKIWYIHTHILVNLLPNDWLKLIEITCVLNENIAQKLEPCSTVNSGCLRSPINIYGLKTSTDHIHHPYTIFHWIQFN